MNTIKLLGYNGNTVKEKLVYYEAIPSFVFFDGVVYEFSHSKNDSWWYVVKGDGVSLDPTYEELRQ